ncbi:hypothetical protein ACHAXR_006560 [Thalassiosira sp. AJA248-18]
MNRSKRRRRRSQQPSVASFLFFITICNNHLGIANGYHRAPCKKVSIRRSFQFSDCYTPNLNTDLYLSQASFVMAHDAATGYLNINHNNNNGGGGTSDNNNNNGNGAYSNEYDGVDNMNNAEYRDGDNNNNNNNNAAHPSRWNTVTTRLLSLYGKTQVGTVYDQLNDGARALDLRPKIYNNGTVGFHHGSLIDVPLNSITLGGLLDDAKLWCKDNPKELVIIFHSELVHEAGYNGLSSQVYLEMDDDVFGSDDDYDDDAAVDDGGGDDAANNGDGDAAAAADEGNDGEVEDDYYDGGGDDDQADDGANEAQYEYYYSGIAKMKDIYQEAGIPYYSCDMLAGLTVGQAMEMADLSKAGGKGYLLAVDRHDMYASFCGKANWAQDQLVTCHSRYYQEGNNNDNEDRNNNGQQQQSYIHCTDTKGTGMSKLNSLQEYVKASTNSEASDDYYELGPPADESYYPFNQIQGFWQVDATSVQIGIMHASNLLDDNRRSNVNEEMVKMAYNGEFNSLSVFALDNVALNGNAMFSVLRNQCGQSILKDDGESPACGQDLIMPNMQTSHKLPLAWNIVLFVVYGSLVLMVSVMLFQAFRLRNEGPQEHRLVCHGHVV